MSVFDSEIFDAGIFDVGIGLAEAGIGLAARGPVDIVISRDWYPSRRSFRPTLVHITPRESARQEASELQEMIEIYSRWRKAA